MVRIPDKGNGFLALMVMVTRTGHTPNRARRTGTTRQKKGEKENQTGALAGEAHET